ncbi:putative gamma-tubulin complex component gcp5 [Phaeomoniella chlamydospora]|uniref:Putative gamma-tubulin complex component gcp5 n=1 Tax=Phaeomoniella chlamydospora TaxID=158046 RepID=A0A0G2GNH3_PHACM|nr:putative gamma-tubulin complex component gcp5 [Phaeomoniella chlamydospora]
MAQSNPATALTESLFASFRKTSQDTLKVKRQRDAFVRKIRTHNYARTNQFDVSTRLDGLLEKFSVLNNDELAEALHARLVELMGRSTKFTPDILDFLLHLSNNPLANSNVVDLEQLIKEPKKTKSLTWDDIEEFDPINKKEWIWRSIHFTDYSSDEDELATSASTSIASETGNVEDDLPADGALETAHVADDLESSLSRAQFWHSEDNLIEITELQAIREGIFMLLGLPASLFWRVDGFIEIDKRYKISRLGYTSSQGALRFLGLLGMQVDHVRLFVQTPQHFSVVQTFQQAVEHYLTSFDHILSRHESEYISITNDRVVSMLSFTDNIKESVDPLLGLLPIISKLNTQGNQTILCLESMFDNIILLETAEAGTSDLLEALDRAEDLDSMIKAHNLFVMNLQHRLLLTRALRPLRDAVTDLLDLCIRFSDVTSASQVSKDADFNADAVSFVTTRTQAPTNKLMDTDSSDEDEASDVEGYSTFSMDQDGLSHVDQIFDVENRMKRQLSFVVSGLQGLARADENPACWDILAERLDWGKQWP